MVQKNEKKEDYLMFLVSKMALKMGANTTCLCSMLRNQNGVALNEVK